MSFVGSVSEYKTLTGNMNTHAGFAWWWLPTLKFKKALLIFRESLFCLIDPETSSG